MRHIVYVVLFVLTLFPTGNIFAQPLEYGRDINWEGVKKIEISYDDFIPVLAFDGARYKKMNNYLPEYFERIPVEYYGDFEVTIVDRIFETIPENEIKNIEGLKNVSDEISVNSHLSYDKKKPFATISFVPLRKNDLTGQYERLVSFKIRIESDNSITKSSFDDSAYYVEHSVLASGNWYKIAVSNNGIYKISYEDLKNYGIDVDALNPKMIRIYGINSGMLPEDPTKFRYDDLQEMSIYVEGEDDNVFNSGDYVLFYGQEPNAWYYNEPDQSYTERMNLYSEHSYYFINVDIGEGKRIEKQLWPAENPTNFVSKYTDAIHYEVDEANLIKSGREWYGETFDLYNNMEKEYSFSDFDPNSVAFFKADVAARSPVTSSFKFFVNDVQVLNLNVASIPDMANQQSDYAKTSSNHVYFDMPGPDLKIKVVYSKPQATSVGWLNYFTINVVRKLHFTGGQTPFRNLNTVGVDVVSEYTVSNANSNVLIWNVSDPVNVTSMKTTLSGNKLKFRIKTSDIKEFVAWDGTSFNSPSFVERVQNQDLHGMDDYELIIVAYPSFVEQAERLADFHQTHDNISSFVVTPQTIYNEFSAGRQDITAIRDFSKMLYDRPNSTGHINYLLMFGDASYDYKDRTEINTNLVPTWESPNSLNYVNSVASDDFFGFLDYIPNDDMVDLCIGRFVVDNIEQAKNAVDKVISYTTNTDKVMGDWRNVVCLVADDEDNNLHLNDSEKLATMIDTIDKNINVDKIYLDSYKQVSTPGGQRYPDANRDINVRMEKGTLIMNYVGHGGELGWAHEGILDNNDILSWHNWDKLAVFVTATCEFSRFDDPTRVSAGENVFLNPNGGAVSLFTTTRPTYASGNSALSKSFYKFALTTVNGEHRKMGEVIRLAKNEAGSSANGRKFVLLGDPAIDFAFPEKKVITLKVNGVSVTEPLDTLKALSAVTISGEMQDIDGNKLSSFNGTLFPTIFDKPFPYTTLGNDGNSYPTTFYIQKNPLYKGKATVENGEWSFSFIVPKDIAYQYGFGKFSYYAKSDNIDAAGYFLDVVVGGYNPNASVDITGPAIKLFMNDESFVFGGLTDQNPILLADIFDESGVNTVGSGIGHDIVATIDNKSSFILNDYYEASLNSYKFGAINYPFFNLDNGLHTLTLRVWDVYNNSSNAYTEFVVAESSDMAMNYLLNYPNPFKSSTIFTFQHNQSQEPIDVRIEVYSISGQLVKTISDIYNSGGYKYKSHEWNGCDEGGQKLDQGIYVYRVIVENADGTVSQENNKLVILK